MNLIVAVDEKWGIGRNGGLLTHLPGDMKYFREATRGKVVVMGRKTLESFPDGKPLKNRVNIVLTGNRDYCPGGVTVCHDAGQVLEALKQYPEEDIFIIGGGMVYREFLPYCNKAYVTCIHHVFEADTDFVDLDRTGEWEVTSTSHMQEYNGITYEFKVYTRRQGL